ncbi:MAG: hypothetical protein WC217_03345 [Candidatus Paceibacterota bacterium]|jgi:hypothetical protein
MRGRNILLLSELKHVDAVAPFLSAHPEIREGGYLVIPLDLEIEYVLTTRGIPFESGRTFRSGDADPMIVSEEWSRALLEDEQWGFFRYRKVVLSQLYFHPLQVYLMSVLYCADIVSNIVSRYPHAERLIVFPSTYLTPSTGFSLESHRIRAFVDVVSTIGAQSNKEVRIPEVTMAAHQLTHTASFAGKRFLFGVGISLLNALVAVFCRPRRIRILASDYWRNLAPYVKHLDSAEVVLIDRKEALRAGLANVARFRMRFLHLDAYAQENSLEQEEARSRIAREWQTVRSSVPALVFRGFSLRSLVLDALESIVDDALEKSLKDIDDAYALVARLKPDVVELRTTISIQTHVGILAQVARTLSIPSLEMQHGLEYYGPGSMDRYHRAAYMGVYGRITQQELRTAGDYTTTIAIGSPRFDVYAVSDTGGAPSVPGSENLVFLCIAPAVVPGMATDTYDVEEYFQSIGTALRKFPHASAVVKLRGSYRESFYRSTIAAACSGVPITIVTAGSLEGLYAMADAVISCNSTAILEAMQCGKPVVYLGISLRERMTSQCFSHVVEEGAMRLATNTEELEKVLQGLSLATERGQIAHKATALLEREYSFDGKASERAAALITTLASRQLP